MSNIDGLIKLIFQILNVKAERNESFFMTIDSKYTNWTYTPKRHAIIILTS